MNVCILLRHKIHCSNNKFIYQCRYNTKYEGNICSRRVNLAKLPRKYHDLSKQCDTLSMDRFDCEGYTLTKQQIEVNHKCPLSENSVSKEIKTFIQENIDLLPHKMYTKLINKGLN